MNSPLAPPGSNPVAGPALGMNMGMALGGLQPTTQPQPQPQPQTQPETVVKRKRGRPRKYVGTEQGGTPGGTPGGTASGASPTVINMQLALNTNTGGASPFTPTGAKRGRGRPPGSGKKFLPGATSSSPATAGLWAKKSFTPHIITIAVGEDVATKIYSFAQHGPRAVCVMSANGAISTATLRQQSSSGGNVTYEGRYEILSLMGSFLPTGGADSRQRAGGLSVSLACSDGRVIGGGVAGILIAASPIQVVVGSFVSENEKTTPAAKVGNGQPSSTVRYNSPAPPLGLTPASAPRPVKTTPAPVTPGHQQAANVTPASNLSSGQPSHHQQQQQPVYQPMGLFQHAMGPWSNPPHSDARQTDINISLPGG